LCFEINFKKNTHELNTFVCWQIPVATEPDARL